jgi:flagellar motor component MotA
MATMNVNSFKKNSLIQFTGVTMVEIDYILSRIGSKAGDIAPGSGLVGAVVHFFRLTFNLRKSKNMTRLPLCSARST